MLRIRLNSSSHRHRAHTANSLGKPDRDGNRKCCFTHIAAAYRRQALLLDPKQANSSSRVEKGFLLQIASSKKDCTTDVFHPTVRHHFDSSTDSVPHTPPSAWISLCVSTPLALQGAPSATLCPSCGREALQSFPGRKEILQPTVIAQNPINDSARGADNLTGQQHDGMEKAPKLHPY